MGVVVEGGVVAIVALVVVIVVVAFAVVAFKYKIEEFSMQRTKGSSKLESAPPAPMAQIGFTFLLATQTPKRCH